MQYYKYFIQHTLPCLRRVHLLTLLFVTLISTSALAQQEPMYSQYMFNMLQINPAYAGNRASSNITGVYRKQWVSVDGAPTTFAISWDKRKEMSNVGYGFQIYNDKLGVENTMGAQGFYSYRIPFRKSFLSFGLSGGFMYYRAELSKLVISNNSDPLFQADYAVALPTAGVGVLYATQDWYAGLSSPALLKTKIAGIHNELTTSADQHYFLTGGYIFQATEGVKLKPSFLLKAVQGAPLECDFNLNGWINDAVGLGVSYRTNDALVTMIELQVSPVFRFGYAYDYIISNLSTYNSGTHELMLRYEFSTKKEQKILSPRYY